jgi:hypothetical protein
MSEDERGRSPELDQLRQTLFPELSPAEANVEIDAALRGQADSERWQRIEQRARRADLAGDLLAILYELREARVHRADDDADDR